MPSNMGNNEEATATKTSTSLKIPSHFSGSAIAFLSSSLSTDDTIITSDAALSLYQRTITGITHLSAPSANILLQDTPPTIEFPSVEELTFTAPLGRSVYPFDIHDVVLRCPKLRTLTIKLSTHILIRNAPDGTVPGLKMPEQVYDDMKMDALLDIRWVKKLQLVCTDCDIPSHPTGSEFHGRLCRLGLLIWQKVREKGWGLEFNMELGPARRDDENIYWVREGCVTYFRPKCDPYDWFG